MKEKVVIGVPTGGNLLTVCAKSLLDLEYFELHNPNERYEIDRVIFSNSLYVQENRNQLVKDARDLHADWLLQIDSDHSFQPELLRLLMRTAEAKTRPIVAGLYTNIGNIREGAFDVLDCIYAQTENGKYRLINPPDDLQPFQVDAAGTGVFLTQLSVYDRLNEPWFFLAVFENPDGSVQAMNEDIAFCRMARSAGFEIWCDPAAEAVHWKSVPLLPSTMRGFLGNVLKAKEARQHKDLQEN